MNRLYSLNLSNFDWVWHISSSALTDN